MPIRRASAESPPRPRARSSESLWTVCASESSRGSFRDGFRQTRRASLGYHDRRGSGGMRGADNRSQVVRILDAVQRAAEVEEERVG